MSSETKETNISVVVRLRPRNQKEIKDNSPIILTTTQNKKEIVVRPSTSNEATSKTYTFDRVFGPDVPQETVFQEVVSGMLSEVLMGYNCTIFAYGQTGTGKTYTMEGDLTNPSSSQAGVIPRTLFSLFDTLERDTAEYSVRVSFTELYNEELKDLLSPEDDTRKLRVFEDLARKGSVVIQGLEEILVKSASDVISVLQKGSLKRQIASTKMNDVSSRSHAIFSITVHTRECTPEGEELLKVGKLNLVDLAGAENIGRSGAENKRAKEAGMINQSLLTLGRVINALVERSPHIPYRESKLTRLLQDSLGGRTKTCIIAAVSPAKCNMEESFSTLDYAHRAKNIRNKPEINQKMTKKTLIREYVNEIERLKSDLFAAREKNGIFLTAETYNSMVDENQSKRDRIDEMTKSMAAKDEQLQALEDAFQEKSRLFTEVSSQLKESLVELDETKQSLSQAMEEIKQTTNRMLEQEFLKRAHQESERRLNELATGLLSQLDMRSAENETLHDKLDQKDQIHKTNLSRVQELRQHLLEQINHLETKSMEVKKSFSQMQHELEGHLSKSDLQLNEDITSAKRAFDSASLLFAEQSQKSNAISETLVTTATQHFSELVEKVHSSANAQNQRIQSTTSVTTAGLSAIREALSEQDAMIHQIKRSFEDSFYELQSEIATRLESQALRLNSAHQHMQHQLHEQISHLDAENARLKKAWAAERQRSAASKQALLDNLAHQIHSFANEIDSSANTLFEEVITKNESHSASLSSLSATNQQNLDTLSGGYKEVENLAGSLAESLKELNITETNKLFDQTVKVQDISVLLEKNMKHEFTLLSDHVTEMTEIVSQQQNQGRQELDIQLRRHNEEVAQFSLEFDKISLDVTEQIATMAAHQNQILSQVSHHNSILSNSSTDFHGYVENNVLTNRSALEEFALSSTQPGMTPEKRKVEYPRSWETTKSEDELLTMYRTRSESESTLFELQQNNLTCVTPSKRKDKENQDEDISVDEKVAEAPDVGTDSPMVSSKLPRIGRSLRSRSRLREISDTN